MQVVFFILFISFSAFGVECELLKARLYAIRELGVYEDLVRESERLITRACDGGHRRSALAADKVLTAMEIIREDIRANTKASKRVAERRLKEAQRTLNMTYNYRFKHPELFFYQSLFYDVARKNLEVKDYEFALKYSQASYLVGRAILDLR